LAKREGEVRQAMSRFPLMADFAFFNLQPFAPGRRYGMVPPRVKALRGEDMTTLFIYVLFF